MAQPALSLLVLVSAAITIYATYRGPHRLVYLFKPLTTSLILLIALQATPTASPVYRTLIVVGLLFSLVGDIYLMLPGDRFLAGLLSFLMAHIVYIAAFVAPTGLRVTPFLLLPYVVYAAGMLWLLWPHIGALRLPVLLYMLVLLTMAWQAAERWALLQSTGALLAAAGALLFVLSDSWLAMDRFRHPFPAARFMVLTSYFIAQWMIALSVYGA